MNAALGPCWPVDDVELVNAAATCPASAPGLGSTPEGPCPSRSWVSPFVAAGDGTLTGGGLRECSQRFAQWAPQRAGGARCRNRWRLGRWRCRNRWRGSAGAVGIGVAFEPAVGLLEAVIPLSEPVALLDVALPLSEPVWRGAGVVGTGGAEPALSERWGCRCRNRWRRV